MATTHANFKAGADLSAKKDTFVKFDGSGDLISAGAGDQMLGIVSNKPASGEPVALHTWAAPGKLTLGGTVAAGNRLKSDAAGKGVAVTLAGDYYGAIALEAGVANDIINVLVLDGRQAHA